MLEILHCPNCGNRWGLSIQDARMLEKDGRPFAAVRLHCAGCETQWYLIVRHDDAVITVATEEYYHVT
jgi:hypothetical protein